MKKSQEVENCDMSIFIHNMRLDDPTTCIYQFIFDKYDSNDTNILQYFVMH